jgi:hypothetical protein
MVSSTLGNTLGLALSTAIHSTGRRRGNFAIQESAKGATRLEIPAHGGTGHSSRCFAYLSSLSQTKKKRGADIKYQRIPVLHRARRAQLYKAFATDLVGLQPPGAAKELDDGSCPTGYGGC